MECCECFHYWRFFCSSLFFAKKNHERQVPIGIINSSWGGTVIEKILKTCIRAIALFQKMIANMPQIDIESLQQKNFEAKTAFLKN